MRIGTKTPCVEVRDPPAFAAGDDGSIATVFRRPFFTMAYGELPSAPSLNAIGPGSHRVAQFDVRAIALRPDRRRTRRHVVRARQIFSATDAAAEGVSFEF